MSARDLIPTISECILAALVLFLFLGGALWLPWVFALAEWLQ